MARNLFTLTISDPTSDPNIDEGNSFTFEVTPGFAGGGGVTAYDLNFEWDQGTATWIDLTPTGNLSTDNTNPIATTTADTPTSITVDADGAGSFEIRVTNDSRSITSGTQAVTVNAAGVIHTRTPDAETLVITGAAPLLSYSWVIPVDVGTLTVLGYAPSPVIGTVIEVPVGTLTLEARLHRPYYSLVITDCC